MDLEDIRQLEKVVDRVAAAPRTISAPHCWFCGKIEAWFRCDCKDAQDAQNGKRNKPRVVVKDGKTLIILDPEVMEREHNQRRKRYVPEPPVTRVTPIDDQSVTPADDVGVSVTPVDAESVTQIVECVTDQPEDAAPVTPPLSPTAARMRRKRERDRAAKEGGDG